MSAWLTIEVQDGDVSADGWRRAHGELLLEAAVTNGASDWVWHTPRWGVILELQFADELARESFRELPAVLAALDAVPDAVFGLHVYPGRGGSSGSAVPRRPRPSPFSDAAMAEETQDEFIDLPPGEHSYWSGTRA